MKQIKWFLSILLVLGMLTGCASSSSGGMGESQAAQMKAIEKKKEESNKKAEETKPATTTTEEPKATEQKNEAQPSNPTTAQPKKEEGSGTPQPAPAPTSPPPASPPPPAPPKQEVNGVTISIVGDKNLGTILPTTEVEIDKNSTVFTVLAKITRSKKIQMEYSDSGPAETIYVKGIDNLYEMDITPESGWMYRVNGVFPNYSAGIYNLKKGDKIEWVYTLDLGRDVGGYMK